MFDWLRSRWQNLLHGLWFVPGAVAVAFGLLAIALVTVDRAAGPGGLDIAFGGTASAAREILSTIAGSIITVAGLAFSITIVTLQLVAGQFSPRATRTFLGDRKTQIAAGIFVGVFLYCLLVLRAVRDEDEDSAGFVPGLGVTVGIALGVVGIGVLLFFINHIAQSLKVSEIAARVARETLASIGTLYPEPYGEPAPDRWEETVEAWYEREPVCVFSDRPGFVQRVDLDELVGRLPEGVERLRVTVAPGDFVTERRPLVAFWPGTLEHERLRKAARNALVVDGEREVAQDPAFGLQQLADLAVRALSTGVNDPATAANAIAYLGACIERLAARELPSGRRAYPERGLDTVVRRRSFEEFVAGAFGDVGRSAAGDPGVASAVLRALAAAAEASASCGADDRAALLVATAERVAAPALGQAPTKEDREGLQEALEAARVAGRRSRSAG